MRSRSFEFPGVKITTIDNPDSYHPAAESASIPTGILGLTVSYRCPKTGFMASATRLDPAAPGTFTLETEVEAEFEDDEAFYPVQLVYTITCASCEEVHVMKEYV